MKLPRSISGGELATALRRVGYEFSRQSGSHIRLTRKAIPAHRITIPNHDYIKVGTLAGILGDVAGSLNISRDELIKKLFT